MGHVLTELSSRLSFQIYIETPLVIFYICTPDAWQRQPKGGQIYFSSCSAPEWLAEGASSQTGGRKWGWGRGKESFSVTSWASLLNVSPSVAGSRLNTRGWRGMSQIQTAATACGKPSWCHRTDDRKGTVEMFGQVLSYAGLPNNIIPTEHKIIKDSVDLWLHKNFNDFQELLK